MDDWLSEQKRSVSFWSAARRPSDNVLDNFTGDQQLLISQARDVGIDLLDYVHPGFDVGKIQEIYLGLENGVDVTCYAKINYTAMQMQELRMGLENGVDIKRYLGYQNTSGYMRSIRLKLEGELDDAREVPAFGNSDFQRANKDTVLDTPALSSAQAVEKIQESVKDSGQGVPSLSDVRGIPTKALEDLQRVLNERPAWKPGSQAIFAGHHTRNNKSTQRMDAF
jgi:hypothetical protein